MIAILEAISKHTCAAIILMVFALICLAGVHDLIISALKAMNGENLTSGEEGKRDDD